MSFIMKKVGGKYPLFDNGLGGFNQPIKIEPLGLTYGRWVMGRGSGTDQVIWSDDGLSWTASITGYASLDSVDFSPEQGLIVFARVAETNQLISSTNSVIWTLRTSAAGISLRGIKWCPTFGANGLWVANGYQGTTLRIQTSPDLINWTTAYSVSNAYSFAVEPGYDGKYYFVDKTPATFPGTMSLVYTEDGINFYQTDTIETQSGFAITVLGCQYLQGVGYFLHGFGLSSTGTPTYFSTGLTASWSKDTQTKLGLRIGGEAGDGVFVSAVSDNSSTNLQYSTDGKNFTTATAPFGASPRGVGYSEILDTFIATYNGGSYYSTSPDGLIWTLRNHIFGNNYVTVRFCPGVRTTAYKGGADK